MRDVSIVDLDGLEAIFLARGHISISIFHASMKTKVIGPIGHGSRALV